MNIRFKKQQYQLNAVQSVVDCFKGQKKVEGISYRVDPGKVQTKIVNGQAVKMTFAEMKRRKVAARIASKKRAAEMSTIERKRKISMNLRNARLG